MWLKLDIGGIAFSLRITNYQPSDNDSWTDTWCRVDFALSAPDWLNYSIDSGEVLLCFEVRALRDKLAGLLNDELNQPETLECIEPDFQFHLFPKFDLRNDPNVTYVAPGHEIQDVSMDYAVAFWSGGGLTANRLLLSFNREDINALLCYLRYITGSIDDTDDAVHTLIAEGRMYGDST